MLPAQDVLFLFPSPPLSPLNCTEGIKRAMTAYFLLFDSISLLNATQATAWKKKHKARGHLH